MKILVTGASGFIGKYVLDELLKTNHTIVVAGRTEPTPAHSATGNQVQFKYLDLNNIDPATNYFTYFGCPDLTIHLAWQGLPNYTQLFHFERNLFHQYQFLKNLVTNGLRSLTVTGTCFEYGMQGGQLSEDLPAIPDNAYALAKYTLYRFLTELKKQHPFQLSWLRLFYMYGSGQSPNSLFSQLTTALERGDKSFNMSGGEQVRDFLPVKEVAAIITKIALLQTDAGIINCCSGQPVKVKDWVQTYLQLHNRQLELNLGYYPYAAYEPMEFWGNVTKLNSTLSDAK